VRYTKRSKFGLAVKEYDTVGNILEHMIYVWDAILRINKEATVFIPSKAPFNLTCTILFHLIIKNGHIFNVYEFVIHYHNLIMKIFSFHII